MNDAPVLPRLTPLLVVRDAASAIDVYARALGARELHRFTHPKDGSISHAELCLGASRFAVTEEAPGWNSDAPPTLGGSPVILQVEVGDVEAAFARAVSEGFGVVFPLMEFCGEKMGRLRDPYGHLWLLSQRLEQLSVEEVQRRRDAFAASGPPKTG